MFATRLNMRMSIIIYSSMEEKKERDVPRLEEEFVSATLSFLPRSKIELGFPGSTNDKEFTCQCRICKRLGFDSWVGKIPEGGHGNPPQYYCLENPMDWQATVHGIAKSQTRLK